MNMNSPLFNNVQEWAQDWKTVHLKPLDAVYGRYLYVDKGADLRYDTVRPRPIHGNDEEIDLKYPVVEPFMVPLEFNNRIFVYDLGNENVNYYWYTKEYGRVLMVYSRKAESKIWIVEPLI